MKDLIANIKTNLRARKEYKLWKKENLAPAAIKVGDHWVVMMASGSRPGQKDPKNLRPPARPNDKK